MAKLPIKANTAENNEGLGDFTAIPAGKYPVVMYKSDYKETKAKTGHYLQCQLKVISGKHKGKVLFENLNLDNPNPVAVDIANKALNSICKACGKVGVQDSEELHNIPFYVTLSVVPATATQPSSNKVQAYTKIEEGTEFPAEEDAPSQTSAPEDESAPPKSKKLPWE